jgi:hypothetical protein
MWPGLCDLFQTFDDLEGVKDKQFDIISVRQVTNGDECEASATQNERYQAW